MPDGPARYLVAIDWEVADLDAKLNAKLAAVQQRQVGKLNVNAAGEVAGITSKLEALADSAGAAVGKVAGMFTGAVERAGELALHLGMIGAAAGIGLVTYGVAHLNVELEQANFALAAVFKAQGYATDFAGAMTIATDQVAKMKTDVKQLPGTFTELVGIMQSISIPASNAHMTADMIRELSEKTMLFAGITGLRQDEAGAGMAQLLAGNARQTSPMARLLGFTGAAAKKLRGESGEEREKDIEKAISKYDAAREAFSHTWKAVSTSVKDDILLSLLAPATSPLFESVKGSLVEIDTWFGENKGQIAAFTGHLGNKLKEAWEWGEATYKKWLPAVTTFAADAYDKIAGIWERIEPTVSRVSEAIRAALGDGTALEHIETVLKLYAAVKVGGMLAPAAGGLWDLGKGALEGAAGGAGAAEGLAALGPALLPVTVGLAGLAAGAWGAKEALDDGTYLFHDAAFSFWADTKEHLANTKANLTKDMNVAGENLSGHSPLTTMAENLGTAGLAGVSAFTWGMQEASAHAELFASILGEAVGPLTSIAAGMLFHDYSPKGPADVDPYELAPAVNAFMNASAEVEKEKPLKPGGGGGAGVNIGTQVNNFTVSTTSEPSRVARTIKNAIAEKSRYPTASPWVQNFSAARSWGG